MPTPAPVARSAMLIRRPAVDVFNAFVEPALITKFWLKSTTGPLAVGAKVRWEFMVQGATETVTVTSLEERRRIEFTWSDTLKVAMRFTQDQQGWTLLEVSAEGFRGKDAVKQAINATEGFTIVLCELKVLLESGHTASLVKDKAGLIERSGPAE